MQMEGGARIKAQLAAMYPSQVSRQVAAEIASHAKLKGEGERFYMPRSAVGRLQVLFKASNLEGRIQILEESHLA